MKKVHNGTIGSGKILVLVPSHLKLAKAFLDGVESAGIDGARALLYSIRNDRAAIEDFWFRRRGRTPEELSRKIRDAEYLLREE